MINIGICDDDAGVRDMLYYIIEDYGLKEGLLFNIIKYNTGNMLLLDDVKLDVLFLDVKMPGINGIEAGKILRQRGSKAKIVYITAFKDYALDAFAVKALGYLVKPFDIKDVQNVLDDALGAIDVARREEKLNIQYITIDIKNIICVRVSSKNQIKVVTVEKDYNLRGSLKEIEDKLFKFKFRKVRRGVMINPVHIIVEEETRIILSKNIIIALSK